MLAAVRSRLLAALRCCASSCRSTLLGCSFVHCCCCCCCSQLCCCFYVFFWFNLFLSLQHVFIWYHLAYSSLLQALVLQQLFIMAPDAVGDMYVMISTPVFFFCFFFSVCRHAEHVHTQALADAHTRTCTDARILHVYLCLCARLRAFQMSSYPHSHKMLQKHLLCGHLQVQVYGLFDIFDDL